jgi:hypothetical protein
VNDAGIYFYQRSGSLQHQSYAPVINQPIILQHNSLD